MNFTALIRRFSDLIGVVAPAQGGLPAGGATAQLLAKSGGADYAAGWVDAPAGAAIGAAVSRGTAGRVLYEGTGPVLADSPYLRWSDGLVVEYVAGSGSYPFTVIDISGNVAMRVDPAGNLLVEGSVQSATGFQLTAFGAYVGVSGANRITFPSSSPSIVANPLSAAQSVFGVIGATGQAAPLVSLQGISSLPATKDLGYIDAGFVAGNRTDATYLGFVTVSAIGWDGVRREGLRVASTGGGAITTLPGTAVIGTLSGLLKGTSGVVSAATAGTDYLTPTVDHYDRPFGAASVSAGGTATLDMGVHNDWIVTLNGTGTLAIANDAGNQPITLKIVQGGAGNFTVTWPGTVTWFTPTFAAPTLAAAAGKATYVVLRRTGAGTYDGFAVGANGT